MSPASPGSLAPRRAFIGALLILLPACGNVDSAGQVAWNPLLPGPWPVGVTRIVLVDPVRDRPLLTEIWYPAAAEVRGQPASPLTDFVDPAVAGLLAQSTVPLVAVRDAAFSSDGPFPLIAFSHGNGGVRFQNTFQVERLASHGFVVAAPDHTGNTLFDLGADPQSAQNRPLDISFLFDAMTAATAVPGGAFAGWIDARIPFGVTGHSFGSFTSLAVASVDRRVGAAVPMAAPGPVSPAYSAPTLLMLAGEDKTIGESLNQGIREVYRVLPGPRFLVEIPDAGHYSFTIACLTGTGLGDDDGCGEGSRFGTGEPFGFTPAEQVWAVTNAYSVALFGRYLKGIESYDEALATDLYPEIARLTSDPRPELSLLAPPGRALSSH